MLWQEADCALRRACDRSQVQPIEWVSYGTRVWLDAAEAVRTDRLLPWCRLSTLRLDRGAGGQAPGELYWSGSPPRTA